MVYIDEFLSKDALDSILQFCLKSTIFFEAWPSFVRARLREGFYGDLIFQIAEELKVRMPKIFENLILADAYADKYENTAVDATMVNIVFTFCLRTYVSKYSTPL